MRRDRWPNNESPSNLKVSWHAIQRYQQRSRLFWYLPRKRAHKIIIKKVGLSKAPNGNYPLPFDCMATVFNNIVVTVKKLEKPLTPPS